MNECIEQMKRRRSIRKYKQDMVPQELLDQIIEAGLYAANGMGYQNTIIIQVTNKKLRDQISKMNCEIGGWKEGFDPFYGAPAMLIVLAKKDWPNRVYDGSLVMGNLMLAAHELGLGSCWIHRAKEEFETEWGKTFLKSLGIEGSDIARSDMCRGIIPKYLQEKKTECFMSGRIKKCSTKSN